MRFRMVAVALGLAVLFVASGCSATSGGQAADQSAKACAEFIVASKHSVGQLDPEKWESAIRSGMRSNNAVLRAMSERAQSAIDNHDEARLVSAMQRIPQICSSLAKSS
jgi:hypothetical protein